MKTEEKEMKRKKRQVRTTQGRENMHTNFTEGSQTPRGRLYIKRYTSSLVLCLRESIFFPVLSRERKSTDYLTL